MKAETEARIHRFRDLVAISVGETPTLYLTPEMAREIASILETYADDVQCTNFSRSALTAVVIEE